jgi:hypothetical protein
MLTKRLFRSAAGHSMMAARAFRFKLLGPPTIHSVPWHTRQA